MDNPSPPPVEVVNENGRSPWVLLCEHASNFIPPSYRGLGLGPSDLQRHIAWDIGAATVARRLSSLIDAPLILSGYSRLLIDCNRPLGAPTSIPEISETTSIPGNVGISEEERQHRAQRFYWPFQDAVSFLLDRRQKENISTAVFGIHSFTPVFKGFSRPWQIGILFRRARVLGERLVNHFAEAGHSAAANEPYRIGDESDFTVPFHGEARGLDALLVEIRQDLIADDHGAEFWARQTAAALSAAKET